MTTWREEVEAALQTLGGQGTLEEIYSQVRKATKRELPPTWQAIVRRELEYNSTDSDSYQGRHNLFYSVRGIGQGVWGLRSALAKTPIAPDTEAPPPERVHSETYRILRDTELARRIKKLHNNVCQLCGTTITLVDGSRYSEAHHIRPLGAPHNGPDIPENVIVLCPNHHVECDYGVIELLRTMIKIRAGHVISQTYLDYHNSTIRQS